MAVVGETIISNVLGLAVNQATSLAANAITKLWGVKGKVNNLTKRLKLIQALLSDAEAKQTTDDAVRLWMEELKDAAYDIEDLLEEYAAEAALRPASLAEEEDQGSLDLWKSRARDGFCLVSDCFLSCCISNPTPVSFRREIAHKFELIEKRLDEITKNGSSLGLVAPSGQPEVAIRKRRETTALLEQGSSPVGREKELGKIIGELLSWVGTCDYSPSSSSGGGGGRGGSCQRKVQVIGIVGMGGMGKTTLAQAIFDNEKVKAGFTMREWVFVGEELDVEKLIKVILKDSSGTLSLHDLQERLKSKLGGHRFLIILDDVWNDNRRDWEPLWAPLTYASEGSAIVVTTRSRDVAVAIGPASVVHELGGLPYEPCWRIFERRAFQCDDSERYYPRLAKLGREIVWKLKGVPLAAAMTGGFLCRYLLDEKKWEWVLNSTVWPQTKEGDLIDQVVDLSYRHLPSHLKLCFGYCATFPKDCIFPKELMVRLWIAQSYIQPQPGRELEDIGYDCFDDLHRSSFFQCINGNYLMHDMVHDYAQRVFKEGCFIRAAGETDARVYDVKDGVLRHLSSSSDKAVCLEEIEKLCNKFKKLRSLQLGFTRGFKSGHVHSFAELKYLRMLSLGGVEICDLPESIGSLKLLRYLHIAELPTLEQLPYLGRLPHLRYLSMSAASKLKQLGPEFYGINVNVDKYHSSKKKYDPQEVFFPSLVTLKFTCMFGWEVWGARRRQLGAGGGPLFFPSLQHLSIWSAYKLLGLPAEVRRRLPALKKLVIMGFPRLTLTGGCDEADMTTTSSSHHPASSSTSSKQLPPWQLQELLTDNRQLLGWLLVHAQKNYKALTSLEQLAMLECLQLISFTNEEEQGLRNLTSLKRPHVTNCSKLQGLPSTMHELGSLQELHLKNCGQIQCLPEGGLPPSLQELLIQGCPLLEERCREGGPDHPKIRRIPRVRLSYD